MSYNIYATTTVTNLLHSTLTNNDENRLYYTKFEFTNEMNMDIINDLLSGGIVSQIHMKIDFINDEKNECKQIRTTILNSNEFINTLNNFMKSDESHTMLGIQGRITLFNMALPIVSIYD